jgi:hypothetical protein
VQSIQRTMCTDRQQSSVAYLAAMIDKRTRDHGLSDPGSGARSQENSSRLETGVQRQDVSVLVWLEGDDVRPPESFSGRRRGMIVVAHGSGQGTTEGSFIISYPVATDDLTQHVPAVSALLEAMGWAVRASRRGRTDGGNVNTAVLVNTAHFGVDQILWLAELVSTAQDRSPSTNAPMPGPSAALTGGNFRTREMHDQVEAWVNEGGAGNDVAS